MRSAVWLILFSLCLFQQARADDCEQPVNNIPIVVLDHESESSKRYLQNGVAVCLYSHPEIFETIQPQYDDFRREMHLGTAMGAAGAALPVVWLLQLFYKAELSRSAPNRDFFLLNQYTFFGSGALVLGSLIPWTIARSHLELMIDKYNVRLQMRLP